MIYDLVHLFDGFVNGIVCVPNFNVLAGIVPWLVGASPVKEAGILNLLLGRPSELDVPVFGKVLKILLEREGQRRLGSKFVYDLLPILLGEGAHGLREVLLAPLLKVDHVNAGIERPLDVGIIRPVIGEDPERRSRHGNGRNHIFGIDERLAPLRREEVILE